MVGDYREAISRFGLKGTKFPGYKIPIDTSDMIPPDIDFNGSQARAIATVNITMLTPKIPYAGIDELIARSKLDPKELALGSATLITTDGDNELEIVNTPPEIKDVKLLIPIEVKETGADLLKDIDVNKISSSRRGKDVYKVDDLKINS